MVNGINDSLIYLLPVILKAVDTFLEELIVHRELADNFCFYQHHYDSLQGAWERARKTLMDHASDEREHIYTREQLEKAKTADPLWNASQLEMVYTLLWQDAWFHAYEIDGRAPSGYVGCMWSICGIHDQFIDGGTMISPTVFARRCLCYLTSEMPQEALGDAMQAQVIAPDWPTAFCLQAAALFRLGMDNDAQESLKDGTSLETQRHRN